MRNTRPRHILLGLLLLPITAAAVPTGLPVDPPRAIGFHTLIDQNDRTVKIPTADGRWQLLFFGYSHCADVCPLTLHKVASLLTRLGRAGDKITATFVSLDSERDSPQRLREYLAKFDPRIQGLTSDPETLRLTAAELGVLVRRYQGKTSLAYTLQHSSFVYLLDPQGRVRQLYPVGVEVESFATDLARLMDVRLPEKGDEHPAHAHMHGH